MIVARKDRFRSHWSHRLYANSLIPPYPPMQQTESLQRIMLLLRLREVQNLTAQKVVMALITLGFFVFSPWLLSEVLSGNTIPLALFAGTGFLLVFFFVLKDYCWLSIPFCLPLQGSLTMLPVKFSPFELSILLTITYVLVQFVMTDRRHFPKIPLALFLPILIIFIIIIFQWAKGGSLGLFIFGGESSGARKMFSILLGCLLLPVILWFPPLTRAQARLIPLLYLAGACLEFAPYLFSSLVPAAAPFMYRFYTTVNIELFESTMVGHDAAFSRIGQLGSIGLALQLALLSLFPPAAWLRPSRWFVPFLSVVSLAATIASGFRSYLFNFLVASSVVLFFRIRAVSFIFVAVLLFSVGFLALGQGSLFQLPLQVQRTLTFLPGDWDLQAVDSAKSSNVFRDDVQKIYMSEFFKDAGLLGQGYKHDARYMKDKAFSFYDPSKMGADDKELVRGFIILRDHHVGWVAVHHPIGWVGFVAFISLCVSSLVIVLYRILIIPRKLLLPDSLWSGALIFQQVLAFFSVFGALQNFLPIFSLCMAVFLRSTTATFFSTSIAPSSVPASAASIPPLGNS